MTTAKMLFLLGCNLKIAWEGIDFWWGIKNLVRGGGESAVGNFLGGVDEQIFG